ncbi:neuronal pentraxin receptor [Bombina bombina]|uniref:neuronal pentraxin receptor n=1 Tax=Bombina bombina TaxID=8345 RepID=UPI00235B0059|nr:neuronal pentraxin receptor [Bombina bombina]
MKGRRALKAVTLKFLAVLLVAGMLAFLGAIICIIASVHPAAKGPVQGAENESSAAAPLEKSLGALHGVKTLYGSKDAFLEVSGSKSQAPPSFSRLLCTPLAMECPSDVQRDAPQPVGEDILFLQTTAEQLRQTVLQQKKQIHTDQEAIRELTSKLSRCENGLDKSYKEGDVWGAKEGTMGDLPLDSPQAVQELEEAVRTLKDRIEKIELEIQQRVHNASSAASTTSPSPVHGKDSLQSKMLELEAQLLAKLLELEKEQTTESGERDKQDIEKELSILQNRIAELESGYPGYHPENFKINFPVRTNYMYGRMKKTLPELYAFTICMWLKAKASSGSGTPFSYSVPGQPNEIVLLEWGHNPMELLINDKVTQLPINLKDGMWHHICVSWTTRDGMWTAYQDGKKKGSNDNLSAWHPIKPDGVIILGQEQDTLGGRFDATQAFVGDVAQFNMWDRALSAAEIEGIANCTSPFPGNLIHWDDRQVDVFGGATKGPFESCEERLSR